MKTLQSLIKSHKFDYVNSNITEENFPIVKRKHGEYKLFHFDKYISSEDVIKEMEKEGFMPANILELIEWKEWNDTDWVVAFGSVGRVRGNRSVPSLDGSYSGRRLHLCVWGGGWGAGFRFLAVRNLDFKPSEPLKSALSSFDTLTLENLEKRIKSLEDWRDRVRS